jgi:hypothetical protein
MNHLYFAAVIADRERVARELAARPRLDRGEPRPRRLRRLAALLGPRPVPSRAPEREITIRQAAIEDTPGLVQLARVSERRLPAGPVLVAEDEAGLVAAVAVHGGPALADVRRSSADVVQLLELRSRQLRRTARAA